MRIEYLADHREVIPILAAWFYREWSHLHPGKTEQDILRLISTRVNRDRIPLTLVAFKQRELIGSVSLKVNDLDIRPDLTPWLAALYVKEGWRGRGIGSQLVEAIEKKSVALGVRVLYLFTPESESFYTKRGWQVMERLKHHNTPITLMNKILT